MKPKRDSRTATAQDGALLSLASWTAQPQERARPDLSAALRKREAAKRPAPAPSPVLAALEKPARRPAARADAGPTLFDLLRRHARRRPAEPARNREAMPPARKAAPMQRSVREARRAAPAETYAAAPAPAIPGSAVTARPRRRAWWLVPLLALAGGLAGYLLAGPVQYSARAELLLRASPVRDAAGAAASGAAEVPAAAVAHSMERATSPQVLAAVVDGLSLAGNRDFGSGDRAAAIGELARRLSVAQQRLTAGYTLTATAGSAALSGEIANAVADALVETHDPDAAGPPPTSLEIAYRAMPGTAAAAQLPWLGAGAGAAAGTALGLLLALAGLGRARQGRKAEKDAALQSIRPQADKMRNPRLLDMISRQLKAAAPQRPRTAAETRTGRATPAYANNTERMAASAPQPSPAPRRPAMTVPRRPSHAEDQPARPAMGGHAAAPETAAPAMPPPAPTPMAMPQQVLAHPAAPYWPHPAATAMPMQPAPVVVMAPVPQPVMMVQPSYPAFAPPMAMMPQYVQPAYAVPPQHFVPAQPQPVPAPAPAAHEPRAQQAADAPAPASAPDADTMAAIDEVRAQLRAFAGSLDALRLARSA